jgi:hypothetical protein
MSISPSTSLGEVSYPLHYLAMSLERSTIQLKFEEPLDTRNDNNSVQSLFPPDIHHQHELIDDKRSMSSDPTSPGHRTNPMSVSALCSPPADSSMPPQFARPLASSAIRLDSPSSSLSSPPHTPPSPAIAVLHNRSPSPAAPTSLMMSTIPANEGAESSASAATSASRKRPRGDSERPQTPVLPPDEYDERTKTWKHATGFRKDLPAGKLTQPEAPTRKKKPSAAFGRRTATPAAVAAARNVLAKSPPSNASQHSGSGESANEEEDELREAADAVEINGQPSGTGGTDRKLGTYGNNNEESTTAADFEPDETARLEKKRRQNTQAARRSRIRKAEEVQKLQNRVADLEAEVNVGQHRLAEAKRDAARLDTLHRNEVEFTGILKNSILNLVGDQKGSDAIAQATQRWRAITSPMSPPAASMTHLHGEQFPEMDYELETRSGARAGS